MGGGRGILKLTQIKPFLFVVTFRTKPKTKEVSCLICQRRSIPTTTFERQTKSSKNAKNILDTSIFLTYESDMSKVKNLLQSHFLAIENFLKLKA